MTSSTKILIPPSATTVERDALPAIPDGSIIHNSTTSKVEYTVDGGSTWEVFASINDLDTVSLQDAYNNGNGQIIISSAGKQFTLVGNVLAFPLVIPGVTTDIASSATGSVSHNDCYARNSGGSFVAYSSMDTEILSNTGGAEDGRLTLSVTNNGVSSDFLKIDDGVNVFVNNKYNVQFNAASNRIDFQNLGAIFTPGQSICTFDFNSGVTEDPYVEINPKMLTSGLARNGSLEVKVSDSGTMTTYMDLNATSKKAVFSKPVIYKDNIESSTSIGAAGPDTGFLFQGISDEAINVGETLKVSTLTNFRFMKIKFGDAATTPMVGVAETRANAAGSKFTIRIGPIFTSTTTNPVTRGNFILRSTTISGGVQASATQVPGSFGVALESVLFGTPVTYMRLYSTP